MRNKETRQPKKKKKKKKRPRRPTGGAWATRATCELSACTHTARARARARTHTHSEFRIFELFYSPKGKQRLLHGQDTEDGNLSEVWSEKNHWKRNWKKKKKRGVSMVQTSKTDHFGCAQQKWCNLNLLHAMVLTFSGNQQKLLFFLNT